MIDWPWKDSIRIPVDIDSCHGSWKAPLMACASAADGPILEIGAGDWSTPFLHHYCACSGRKLVTFEDDHHWAGRFGKLQQSGHQLWEGEYQRLIQELAVKTKWAVVLVDGSPGHVRWKHALALRGFATFLVVHDYSGQDCIDTFTPELLSQWPHRAEAPRPRYSPSSLVLGQQEIPKFEGMKRPC